MMMLQEFGKTSYCILHWSFRLFNTFIFLRCVLQGQQSIAHDCPYPLSIWVPPKHIVTHFFFKAIFHQNWHRVRNKFPLPCHYCWDSVDCDLFCSHFLLPCDSSVCLSHTDIRFVVPAGPRSPFWFCGNSRCYFKVQCAPRLVIPS